MAEEIEVMTKAQYLRYLLDDDSFGYYGEVQHDFGDGVKIWQIFRTRMGAGSIARGYRVVRYEKDW